jgi:transcriptional regulator with XRE-family HTH domain
MWFRMHTINSFAHRIFLMSKKNILIAFGEKVRELRKEKGLSQEDLSFKADLHRTYIGMIERAEKNITLINIEKIAKALNVDIKELFDGEK